MNAIKNLKNFIPASFILLFAATALTAQNEIHSTQTDEKHGNTTVVYTKNANYDDQAILAQLDNSYGIGDVVRIAVAQPNQSTSEMMASNDPAIMFATTKSTATAATKTHKVATPAPQKVSTVKATPAQQTVKTVVTTPKVENTVVNSAKPAVVANPARKTSLKKGGIFRLEKVYFDADKFELKDESEEELTRLLEMLNTYPQLTIEVRGHTNNVMWPNADFANELSTNRAKAVADWLTAKGIAAERVQHKGYGWTMPIQPNITAEGRKKNQRVEVKILNL